MSGAIQTRESGAVANFKTLLEGKRDQLAQLVPKHLTVERLMKVAVGAMMKSPNLQKCTPSSLLNCFIGAAEVGLEPGGVLGHAYLVPYGDTATMIIGYRGLIELMRRTGELASIRCVVVHEKDTFKLTEGIEQTIKHEPFLAGDAGPLKFAYCVAKLKDGSVQVELMTRHQIEEIRKRSRAGQSGPWVTDFEEMAKKTVLRRAAKYLPVASERFQKAIEIDDGDYVDGGVITATLEASERTQSVKERVKSRLQIQDVASNPSPTPPPVLAPEPPPLTDADMPGGEAA